ncbi:MAG: efflux RND transporter permease subunit [Gammaproteobacteria bacterium]|nr:efflux RND transporter permease subunit [Gammaproteobacteria bacterium]
MVTAPGLAPDQVARQIAAPLEKLLAQIPGVERVYARSDYGRAVVTVRFYVGENRESALVRLYNQLFSNTDRIPALVADWVVKPIEIDDVPIVVATLWSEEPERVDDHALHRLAQEVGRRLQRIEDTNRIDVFGGRPREWRVELDPEALAGRRTTVLAVVRALSESSRPLSAGSFQRRIAALRADGRPPDPLLLRNSGGPGRSTWWTGVPVHLSDVARVVDGPAEPVSYGWLRFGPARRAAPARTPARARPCRWRWPSSAVPMRSGWQRRSARNWRPCRPTSSRLRCAWS